MYSLKLIQNKSKDLFNSMVLIFSNKSYLFNCCEGTQRNASDQGIKFKNIEEVFYSSSEIDCYSGTFGFIMSRSEQLGTFDSFLESQKVQNKQKEKKPKLEEEKIKNETKGIFCYLIFIKK